MRKLFALALVAVLSVSSIADEKPNKKKGQRAGNPVVAKLTSSLQDAGLSEEQMSKIKAAAATFEAAVKELRQDGMTPELNKKRAAAMKEARDAGLKGKDIAAKVNESLTAEEIAMLEKMNAAMTQMKKTVVSVLTEEQMEALPAEVKKQLQDGPKGKPGKGEGKGKKKKDAA